MLIFAAIAPPPSTDPRRGSPDRHLTGITYHARQCVGLFYVSRDTKYAAGVGRRPAVKWPTSGGPVGCKRTGREGNAGAPMEAGVLYRLAPGV
jgi:hypothetical protein